MLNITGGGSVSTSSDVYVGNYGSGTVAVGGGNGSPTWSNNVLYVGYGGAGDFIITGGGSVSTTSNAYVGTNVTNGTVYNGAGTATVGGGTGASTWTTLQNLLVGGSGTGTLTIMGGGGVSASDVLIGDASGSNGTVSVGGGSGNATLTTSGNIHVGNSGTGTLNITSGGSVSVGGNYNQNSSSNLELELNETLAQPGHIPLTIDGIATLAGTLQIDPASDFAPTVGEMLDILSATGGVSGTFGSVNSDWIASGWLVGFTIAYGANKVTIDITSVISAVAGRLQSQRRGGRCRLCRLAKYVGTFNTLPNDPIGGPITPAQYNLWRANFGVRREFPEAALHSPLSEPSPSPRASRESSSEC